MHIKHTQRCRIALLTPILNALPNILSITPCILASLLNPNPIRPPFGKLCAYFERCFALRGVALFMTSLAADIRADDNDDCDGDYDYVGAALR